jgi:adenylylsulfate kinase
MSEHTNNLKHPKSDMPDRPAWTVWLTGLPASGKTTVARALQQRLRARGTRAVLLDSDALRQVLTPDAAYTPQERDFFYTALVGLARLLAAQDVNVIIAATANRRRYRAAARQQLSPFFEIWVDCPLEVCRARDPKGLYAQAAQEADSSLPGFGALYEPPEAAELIVHSNEQTADEASTQILALLDQIAA